MKKGKVKFYNTQKGFGFIIQDEGEDLFFHHTCVEGEVVLKDNDRVEFEVGTSQRGDRAVNVKKVGGENEEQGTD